ncbi:MAG: glycosyltransferase family 39 protein [Candidatus Pacebacteria bacterium]|nr:glycosyltransferase family 39 protein [Candidatus Paceibacterota bacterium]
MKEHKLLSLFLIVFALHIVAVLVMHFNNVSSFFSDGIGDYMIYDKGAAIITEQFSQGNLSIEKVKDLHPEIYLNHFYPVVVTAVYFIFGPNILAGELLNAVFCALISVFVYLIIVELAGEKKWAFLTGLIVGVYPSLVFNGSLLLKDALQVCLTMAALFFAIKIIKNFNIRDFLIFYILLFPLTNLRFYCGYAVMLTFGICWLFFAKSIDIKKRTIYAVIIAMLFGFVPLFSTGHGYFGVDGLKYFLNKDAVTSYRHAISSMGGNSSGSGSDLGLKTSFDNPIDFAVSYLTGFIYVSFAPFVWQLKYARHFLALFEMIPWYFMLYFIIRGIVKCIRDKKYQSYILLAFAVIFLMALALFDSSNFGLFMRIRIPAFICLLCFLPFGVNDNLINKLKTKLRWLNI